MKHRWLTAVTAAAFWAVATAAALALLRLEPAPPHELRDGARGMEVLLDTTVEDDRWERIVSVDSVTTGERDSLGQILAGLQAGRFITVGLAGGGFREVWIPGQYGSGEMAWRWLPALLLWLFAFHMGLQPAVPARSLSHTAFFAAFLWASYWPQLSGPPWLAVPVVLLFFLALPRSLASLWIFSYQFPVTLLPPEQLRFRRTLVGYLALTGSIGLLTLYLIQLIQPGLLALGAFLQAREALEWSIFSVVLIALLRVAANARHSGDAYYELQSRWSATGLILATTPALMAFHVLPLYGIDPDINARAVAAALFAAPLCWEIAFRMPRRLQLDVLFKRGLAHLGVLSLALVIYGVMVQLAALANTATAAVPALATITLIVACHRGLLRWAERAVERVFYKSDERLSHGLQQYETAMRSAGAPMDEVREALRAAGRLLGIEEYMVLRQGEAVFVLPAANAEEVGELAEWVHQYFPEFAGTQVAAREGAVEEAAILPRVELPGRWHLCLMIDKTICCFLGARRCGRPYRVEEIRFLESVAGDLTTRLAAGGVGNRVRSVEGDLN